MPPIAKHNGQPTLEKEAFALKPGELSGVIQMGDKYVILFCEGYTTPEKVEYDKVRDLIYEDIREKKQQLAMTDLFDHLQKTATIDNFLAGKSQSPDRAAGGNDPDGGRLPTLREVPAARRRIAASCGVAPGTLPSGTGQPWRSAFADTSACLRMTCVSRCLLPHWVR